MNAQQLTRLKNCCLSSVVIAILSVYASIAVASVTDKAGQVSGHSALRVADGNDTEGKNAETEDTDDAYSDDVDH